MIGLYRAEQAGSLSRTSRCAPASALPSKNRLGFGCLFADLDLDGALDLVVANGHIDETVRNIRGNVGYAQPPHLFLNHGKARFATSPPRPAATSRRPRVGRGLAVRRFRSRRRPRPADDDQQRPGRAVSQRPAAGNRSLRFTLVGTKSNRDAIGAIVRIFHGGITQSRMVQSGSSYLSQSELPVTFGVGKRDVSIAS